LIKTGKDIADVFGSYSRAIVRYVNENLLIPFPDGYGNYSSGFCVFKAVADENYREI